MSAKAEVPVFYRDQDDSVESPCQIVPRAEARQMKKDGLGYFVESGRKFRLYGECPRMAQVLPPSGTTAPSTISYKEARANVGITEESERYPARTIRRAREKIRIYPFVGDTQAPLARYA